MPPQQRQGLLEFVDNTLNFCTHTLPLIHHRALAAPLLTHVKPEPRLGKKPYRSPPLPFAAKVGSRFGLREKFVAKLLSPLAYGVP